VNRETFDVKVREDQWGRRRTFFWRPLDEDEGSGRVLVA
jgi:hypothetical protein